MRYQNCKKRLLALSCLSVRPSAWKNSASTGRVFMTFDISLFFENLSRKFTFPLNPTRIRGTLYEDQYTVMTISCSVLLRMRSVSDKSCTENKKHSL